MREGESKLDRHSLKGPVEEKGTPHPEKSPTQWKEQPNWKNLPMQISVSQSSEKQSENQTDHLNYWHSHQKLKCLGGAGHRDLSSEVSPQEQNGLECGDCMGGLGTGLSGLIGKSLGGSRNQSVSFGMAETAWETRKQSIVGEGAIC